MSTPKRIRGLLNGKYIFDTTDSKLVWEHPYFPHYWIPKKDFLGAATFADAEDKGPISKVSVGDEFVSALVVESDTPVKELTGYVKIEFKSLEAWFEEEVQIYFHPKDPYHRVDVLPTARSVRVELNGQVLADTKTTGGVVSLWETGFPARWYLPRTAISWDLLKPSATQTGCPYKGQASYYDAVDAAGKAVTKDVAWWYRGPTPECTLITGLLCFYPDKVDTLLDGKPIEKIGMPIRAGIQQSKLGNAHK